MPHVARELKDFIFSFNNFIHKLSINGEEPAKPEASQKYIFPSIIDRASLSNWDDSLKCPFARNH